MVIVRLARLWRSVHDPPVGAGERIPAVVPLSGKEVSDTSVASTREEDVAISRAGPPVCGIQEQDAHSNGRRAVGRAAVTAASAHPHAAQTLSAPGGEAAVPEPALAAAAGMLPLTPPPPPQALPAIADGPSARRPPEVSCVEVCESGEAWAGCEKKASGPELDGPALAAAMGRIGSAIVRALATCTTSCARHVEAASLSLRLPNTASAGTRKQTSRPWPALRSPLPQRAHAGALQALYRRSQQPRASTHCPRQLIAFDVEMS